MSARDAKVYLEDILNAARHAARFVEGLSFDQFAEDRRTTFAVVRALEIVGEATKRVPATIRDRASAVPWQEMAGMRDKLIHSYQSVDLVVVWRTATEEIPTVVEEVERLLVELE